MPIRKQAAFKVAADILPAHSSAMLVEATASMIMAAVDTDEKAVALEQTEREIEAMLPGYLRTAKND